MSKRKIIPCLDFKDGKVVKGTNFVGLREMGDAIEMAEQYSKDGADEIVFLDISATTEGRKTLIDVVTKVAEKVTVPFTVGGGVRTLDDIDRLLVAGANKVGINSAAVENPTLLKDAVEQFGGEKIVVSVDGKRVGDRWHVMVKGGTVDTGLDVLEWCKTVADFGVGSILLTSVDQDGVKDGYDLELNQAVANAVSIPVIASGGCGSAEHIVEVFEKTNVAAALAASIFHEQTTTIQEVKRLCKERGVDVIEA